jgi:hypothetical protein
MTENERSEAITARCSLRCVLFGAGQIRHPTDAVPAKIGELLELGDTLLVGGTRCSLALELLGDFFICQVISLTFIDSAKSVMT